VLVLEAVAPDGYSGKIALLIAIRNNGELAGVRVVAHKETPGLGDYIEIARSNWIVQFNEHRVPRTPPFPLHKRGQGQTNRYVTLALTTLTGKSKKTAVNSTTWQARPLRRARW